MILSAVYQSADPSFSTNCGTNRVDISFLNCREAIYGLGDLQVRMMMGVLVKFLD